MKRILLGMVLIFSLCLSTVSIVQAAGKPYANLDWLGQYVFSSGFVASPHPVWQPEVGVTFDNGFGAALWASLPASLQHIDQNMATEIDFCLWYAFWKMQLGASYYAMWPMSNLRTDIFQANIQINGDEIKFGKLSINTTFRIEANLPADGVINKETMGIYLLPMLDFSYHVTDKLKLSLGNKFCIDLGGYGADKAWVVRLSPGVNYQFTKNLSASMGVNIHTPIIQSGKDPRELQIVPRVGISYSF